MVEKGLPAGRRVAEEPTVASSDNKAKTESSLTSMAPAKKVEKSPGAPGEKQASQGSPSAFAATAQIAADPHPTAGSIQQGDEGEVPQCAPSVAIDSEVSPVITEQMVWQFLYPLHLKHPAVLQRLFLLGIYGNLDSQGRMRGGYRGKHILTDAEVRVMTEDIFDTQLHMTPAAASFVRSALLQQQVSLREVYVEQKQQRPAMLVSTKEALSSGCYFVVVLAELRRRIEGLLKALRRGTIRKRAAPEIVHEYSARVFPPFKASKSTCSLMSAVAAHAAAASSYAPARALLRGEHAKAALYTRHPKEERSSGRGQKPENLQCHLAAFTASNRRIHKYAGKLPQPQRNNP
ncbi:hypothetical protein Emed_005721 [Eimeria media]